MRNKFLVVIFCMSTVVFSAVEGIPPLSENAQSYLDYPVINSSGHIRTGANRISPSYSNDWRFEERVKFSSLDAPECIDALNSFFDGMSPEEIEQLRTSAKREIFQIIGDLFSGDAATGNVIMKAHRRVPQSSEGILFWNFLNRDPQILPTISNLVEGKIPNNLSSKEQIALIIRVLQNICREADTYFNLQPDEDDKVFNPAGPISKSEYKRQLFERLRNNFDDLNVGAADNSIFVLVHQLAQQD